MADTLLQREALVCRLGDGVLPHDFAGLYVGREEIDRILRGLPGLGGATAEQVGPLLDSLAPGVAAAREAFVAELTGPSPFARIVRRAGLDLAAAEVLALLAGIEMSPQRMRLVAYVQDNVALPRPTLATLARLFAADAGHPAERCVAPGSALRRAELVEVGGDGPWAVRMCALAPRVVWALRGADSPDPGLPAGTRRRPGDAKPGDVEGTPELLLVTGADAVSRRRVVERRWADRGTLIAPVPAAPEEWTALVREATLAGPVVLLELDEAPSPVARERIAGTPHLTWVLSSARELPLDALPDRPWSEIRLDAGIAGPDDWSAALGVAPDPAYRLTRSQLALVAAAADGDPTRLPDAVRRLAGGHLDTLAVRIRPRRSWPDLVLPADHTAQLHEMAARYRGRDTVYQRWGFSPLPSTGVVALFSGPSGTGKTLAAEVIAGELGLDLYKVDLSSVVSKYIGETEKNLERIFSAAASGDLVLFFDEADALFGKRSEVSDAHDRYANIEVAYLLQRLEAYPGIVILATNLQRNIDQAFLRRISVAVDFELPDEPQRRLIWEGAFPPGAPVDDLDLDFLARQFRVSGGIIHNAALAAAFRAADERGTITMERVAFALKREFQKLGRLRTETEFERYFDLVNGVDDAAPTR
ncbi:MAG: ATPase [Actinobacteria bacterium 13_2_20CM_2_71_6]|nr:MAG: ATPase [Actinobacteria bacterium 13_2_20CM_2_71_6]